MRSTDQDQNHHNYNEEEIVLPRDSRIDAILDGSTPLTSEDHKLFRSLLPKSPEAKPTAIDASNNPLRGTSFPKKEEPFVISA